jgi:competence protein ComFC
VKRIIASAGSFIRNLQQIALQDYCRLCNSDIGDRDKYFCPDCWQSLGFCIVDSYCLRCGKEISVFGRLPDGCADCQGQDFHFDSIHCLGAYREPLRNLIVKFKLSDRTELLAPLVNLAQNAVERMDFRNAIDYVVPVPLHWRKRFKRGFNQSALIAKRLDFGNAGFNTDLVRTRYTDEQVGLSPAARRKNVKGAFAVRSRHDFEGKSICLFDDIKTTGATLNECAKVLKEAGAKKVFAFVLAVAGQQEFNS